MLPSMFESLEQNGVDLGFSGAIAGELGKDQASSSVNLAEARRSRYEEYQSPQRQGNVGTKDHVEITHAPPVGASQETLEYIADWRHRHANVLV